MRQPIRFASLDIETTSLDASYGRILCVCVKFSDEKEVVTLRADRLADEKHLLKQLRKLWDEVNVVVTWNGKMFDIPYINARLLKYSLRPLEPRMHLDLRWQSAKLRTRGNSLAAASKDANIRTSKHEVTAEGWLKASQGTDSERKKFCDKIAKHCAHDVQMTEEMLFHYRHLICQITR